MPHPQLPPGQQLAAIGKWPSVGEREPRPDRLPWQVVVTGGSREPRVFSLADLRNMPQVARTVDIHCVTRWSKLDVQFSGVPLAALLAQAGSDLRANFVSFVARSVRDHSTSLPLAEAIELKTLIALSVDGQPLDELRGGPLRVIVPGRYFYKSLKWLERIELLGEDRLGFWESTAGYHNTADPWREQRYMAGGITKAEAREVLASRDISGRDLRSLAAEGRDLAGLQARSALLRDANFRGCKLQGACFDGANLTNAHFEDADLRDASFASAGLDGANLTGADLRGANLLGATLFGASFCTRSEIGATSSAETQIDEQTRIHPSALEDLTPDEQEFLRSALARAAEKRG